ncbi:hypothetical protein OVY01_05880 [Robbsia sp. Bb-Pol-6]|uniref:Uncharacterized protein n=1 Tax=Robbsia betulipollinis TaxID=2981849 RepID=A0ABT3ZJQ2_9BURK|nr:hypothetical protein [Robbsia betulipollinis]MCY0386771.1 hypothetical protein [Robbsia betulipollinis]
MKIAFIDFKRASKMLGLANGPLQTAVDAANQWMEEEAVTVLNVETLRHTNGTSGMTSTKEDGIRIWYHRS